MGSTWLFRDMEVNAAGEASVKTVNNEVGGWTNRLLEAHLTDTCKSDTRVNESCESNPSPEDGISKNRRKKLERIARRKRKLMEKKEAKKTKKRMMRDEAEAETKDQPGNPAEVDEERRAKTEANRQLRRHIRQEFQKAWVVLFMEMKLRL